MIALDYSVSPGWSRRLTMAEIENPDVANLAIDIYQSALVFVVNGVDLSWNADIPMLDFARTLFCAASALTLEKRRQQFISPDLEPWTYLTLLDGDVVSIQRQGIAATATCLRHELVKEAAIFGLRVFNDYIALYPNAKNSVSLNNWYPLEEMRQKAASSG